MRSELEAHFDQRLSLDTLPLDKLPLDKLSLDTLPSPLVACTSFSTSSGIEVDLKRDDLLGDLLTGTKVRALSYILWQAIRDGVTDLITIGEPTSNQCRLTAILAARHGLDAHILLRGDESAEDHAAGDNLEIMRLFGAHLQFLSEDEWRLHGMAVKRLTVRLRKAGKRALFLPFGCGGIPGAFGIINLLREVTAQKDGCFPYDHVIVPTGSGSTLFALDLGFQTLDLSCPQPPKLVGVSVSQDSTALLSNIDRLYVQTGRALDLSLQRRPQLTIDDRWTELTPTASSEALRRIAQAHGILPDPLYVLRAFLALEDLLSSGAIGVPSKVLLLITGACRTLQVSHSPAKDSSHAA